MTTKLSKTQKIQAGLDDARRVFDKIEYSSDGFVKRYPPEEDYFKALKFLFSLSVRQKANLTQK